MSNKKKRNKILGSFEFAAFPMLSKGLLDNLIKDFAARERIPVWLVYIILMALGVIVIEFGVRLWRRFWNRKKSVFSVEEREQEDYQDRITDLIKTSHTIHLLLLSGYTMFWDDRESSLLKAIQALSPEERAEKDFRILMLHPESDHWKSRARLFVRKMKNALGNGRVRTVEEYKQRCLNIISDLEKLGATINFYTFEPQWRLHIFDSAVFISFYGRETDGHLTSCYCFPKTDENSIYHGFTKYFNWYWKWAYKKTDKFPRTIHCPNCEVEIPYTTGKRKRRNRANPQPPQINS
jgi:cell division protein FtsL